jgi:hypothetical protein
MKDDEKIFFFLCLLSIRIIDGFNIIQDGISTPRDIIEKLASINVLNSKRAYYLLKKWSFKNFYTYGTTIDLGWFEVENLEGEYKNIYENVVS